MGVKRVTSQTELDSIAGPRFVVADARSGAWMVYTGDDMPRVDVPFSVTRRQFLEGCDRLGLLSVREAEDAKREAELGLSATNQPKTAAGVPAKDEQQPTEGEA